MTMKNEVPYRNRSPYGWWIATYLLRATWSDEPDASPKSRCLAWENTIILRADDREEAYQKALAIASNDASEFECNDRKARWICEGLVSLLPIHEKLTDGAEILWVEHKNKTVQKIRSWVKSKDQLEVFQDE